MTSHYRDQLFQTYHATHVAYVDHDDKTKLAWFTQYAESNYLPHLTRYDRTQAAILDVGCNKGYLLAALQGFGFKHLTGIDLSPVDVEQAIQLVPNVSFVCTDAQSYLQDHIGEFDVIFIKAVLEHIAKADVLPLLTQIKAGLKPGGTVVIDVPNMDWLFASHERYMDFTHEVGFTKESLRQVMLNVFPQVTVIPVDSIMGLRPLEDLKKRLARYMLGKLLLWADPQGGRGPLWSRSLLAIGTKPTDSLTNVNT